MSHRSHLCLRRLIGLLVLLSGSISGAGQPTSENYRVPWDSLDGGGGTSLSTGYSLSDSIAVVAAGRSSSPNYDLSAGFHAPPDDDGDSVRSFVDNCIDVYNPEQRDSNADGYGNACDADLNNDGVINAIDLGLLKLVFFSNDMDADFNGDNVVNTIDLGILKLDFFGTPGPSGPAD